MKWRQSELDDFIDTKDGLKDRYFGDVMTAEKAGRARYAKDPETGQMFREFELDQVNWQKIDEQIKWDKENR